MQTKILFFMMKCLFCILLALPTLTFADDGRRDFNVYYEDINWPGNKDSCNPRGLIRTSDLPYMCAGDTTIYDTLVVGEDTTFADTTWWIIPVCAPATHYSTEFHDATNAAQRAAIAERYEFGIGQDARACDSVRLTSPNFGWNVYNSFQDNLVTGDEQQYMIDSLSANGYDPELMYLHFWDDTWYTLQGQEFFIAGWGNGSYTDSTESRIPVYWASHTRMMCNYSDSVARVYYVKFMRQLLQEHPTEGAYTSTGYYNGIFWDNCQPEVYNMPTIASGGHVREHPDHARSDSLGSDRLDWWYPYNIKPYMQELMDTLALSSDWMPDECASIRNILNTGNMASRMATDGICTHLFWEFCPGILRNYAGSFVGYYAFDTLCCDNGVGLLYSPNVPDSINGYAGSYDRDEVLLSNLCWFYASCTDSTLLFQQGNNGPTNFYWDSLNWCGAMDQDIGDPLATFDTIQTGTDPKGYSYNVLSRDYDSALVLVRPRSGSSQDIDETTSISVTLGDSYYELDPDGTRGSVVTTVDLRNAQGKIMMKNSGEAFNRRKKRINIMRSVNQ